MKIYSIPVIFSAGIIFYVFFHYLLLYFYTKDKKNLLFSLSCFSFFVYNILSFILYNSNNINFSIMILRLVYVSVAFLSFFVLWYIIYFTNDKKRIIPYIFSVLFIVNIFISLFVRGPLTWTPEKTAIKDFILFNTFHIKYIEPAVGILVLLQSVVGLIGSVYVAYIIIKFFIRKNIVGLPMFIGIIVLFITAVNDILINYKIYNFIYIFEYGYFVFIICMTVSFSYNQMLMRKQVKKSKERIAEISSNIPGIVFQFVLNKEGSLKLSYISNGIKIITGYNRNKFNSDLLLQLIYPSDREKFLSSINKSAVYLKTWIHEFRIFDKSGNIKWLRISSNPHKHKNGETLYNGVAIDITEKKENDNKIKESEKKYKLLFGEIKEGISLSTLPTNEDFGRIIEVNDAYSRIIGYSKKELNEVKIGNIFHGNEMSKLKKLIEELFITKHISFETLLIKKNKKVINVEINANIIKLQKEKFVLSIVRDITDRKKIEEEKEFYIDQLSKKNSDLKSVIHIASHDLRSPLVNIIGFNKELKLNVEELINYLESKEVDSEYLNFLNNVKDNVSLSLDYILKSTNKMDKLLTGLVQMSRIGRASLTVEKLNMNNIILSIIDSIQYKIIEKGIDVKIEILPGCMGDENQINQLFTNILDNALKYMDKEKKGKIVISGESIQDKSIYHIEDNGIGMKQKDINNIFNIFYRIDPKDSIEGQGLGLTIVKKIIENHAGNIDVESDPGKGTKFIIMLPNK